ncbi:MAG: chemotaxis protein CheW [Sphingobium sp.]
MLYMIFDLGGDGYALAANEVVEMLPFIVPKPVRGAPAQIAGSIGYRGRYLPLIDLARLELGRPAERRMGTRIAVIAVPVDDRQLMIGLILEQATEMLNCEPGAFRPFAQGPRGLVQRFDIQALLPSPLLQAVALLPEAAP